MFRYAEDRRQATPARRSATWIRGDTEAPCDVHWGLIIADEAQLAKNPLSRTARHLRELKTPARIALTGGTPVENRLSELWSIMDQASGCGCGSSRPTSGIGC
ncbi:MAG: SNF2-related protein [Micromonosporaceae bacterium]